MSHVTCHMSRVMSHVSRVTCHMSLFFYSFSLTKWWSFLVEGLLSTGPTPSSFQKKYCDLLFYVSFTKFTGPAKLFLWWWSLQRGQLNKSLCGCRNKHYKIRYKLTNFMKLDPLSCLLIPVFFFKIHWVYYSCVIVSFLNLFVNQLFGGSLKMST